MQKKFKWEAFSERNRNRVIEEVKKAISNCDGYIINFNMFSDLAIHLSIEIAENQVAKLYASLANHIKISPEFQKDFASISSKECLISLNINFTLGTGNLKREIPAVPG